MSHHVKRLGTPTDVACQPLVHALRGQSRFDVEPGSTAENALLLRSRSLDVSFISPIEYAKEGTDYVIVPGAALSSLEGADTITLHFRAGLRGIRTIAVDPASAAEVVLAMIVLQEEFDVRPSIVPVAGGLDLMLGRADAALLVGNASLQETLRHANRLDLVDHWIDLTGLPYVCGFWCSRRDVLTREELAAFGDAADRASALAAAYTPSMLDPGLPTLPAADLQTLLAAFGYAFSPTEQEAVEQFLRYAFYHGMLPDVPEIRLSTPPEDDSPGFVESEPHNR